MARKPRVSKSKALSNTFSEDGLRVLLRIFETLRQVAPKIQTQAAHVLFFVAQNSDAGSGPNLKDIAGATGIPQPTVTRIIRVLGSGDDKMGPAGGLGLVSADPDADEHRSKVVLLTKKGRDLVAQLVRQATELE